MMEPMHETVAEEEPDTAPNTAQATTVTTPRPLLDFPIFVFSTAPTSFSPRPPLLMREPASTNSGIVSSRIVLILL